MKYFLASILITIIGLSLMTCDNGSMQSHKHEFGIWRITTHATCIQSAIETGTCTCGEVTTRTIGSPSPNAHNWGNYEGTEADCISNGEGTVTCNLCHITDDIVINVLGHNWGEAMVKIPATCEIDGLKEIVCSRCAKRQDDVVIPKLGHGFIENWIITVATPSSAGNKIRNCQNLPCTEFEIKYLYYISFDSNGGSAVSPINNAEEGSIIIEPAFMSKEGFFLEGWYKEHELSSKWNFNKDIVTTNIILYAKWESAIFVSGSTIIEKFQWLFSNAVNNGNYIVEVNSTEYLNPIGLSFLNNISIRIISNDVGIIYIYGTGSLFTIYEGVTLILDHNITLSGNVNNNNNASLIKVNSGGTLIINQNAKITNNKYKLSGSSFAGEGGGVHVSGSDSAPGTLIMNGGEISGNYVDGDGGGVYISNFGSFTMNGGEITNNEARNTGGGVYFSGEFTMNDGKITKNIVSGGLSYCGGGGVSIKNSTFTMNGGEISGNRILANYNSKLGGGVYVNSYSSFIMNDGLITNNSSDLGGGVYVNSNSSFIMNDGLITNNTSSGRGGGVFIIDDYVRFEKTGGIITGYVSDNVNGNQSNSSNGHAVYVDHNDPIFRRKKDTTASVNENLTYIRIYSSPSPLPPTIYGSWDN